LLDRSVEEDEMMRRDRENLKRVTKIGAKGLRC